jgi:tRNA pseudouridine-54 N-methylase
MKTPFFSEVLLAVLLIAGPAVPTAVAQEPTPVTPQHANFDFHRGVVSGFEPASALSIIEPGGKVRTFVVPEKIRVVSQAGKALMASVIKEGTDVTVTVEDPEQADATPIVYKVVVANPLVASAKRTSVQGLVIKISEGQNVITLKPNGEKTQNVSVIYNEGDTEFVGGDGQDVGEEDVQAGDRLLIYVGPQEDGGLMAERVIFLGDSADPNYVRRWFR